MQAATIEMVTSAARKYRRGRECSGETETRESPDPKRPAFAAPIRELSVLFRFDFIFVVLFRSMVFP